MKRIFLWILTLSWALIIWRLTTTTQIVVTSDSWLQNILMMGAHFSFFGIQAILLSLSFSTSYKLQSTIWPITLASLYGALIEFRQLYVVGRSADGMDWVLDTLGAIAFLIALKKIQSKL